MLKLTVEPNGNEHRIPAGSDLADISDDRDLGIFFGCRQGACGSCLISVDSACDGLSEKSEQESSFLESLGAEAHQRLACQCDVLSDTRLSADPDHVFKPSGDATKPGILILSHRGFSFLEDLSVKARKLGFEVYILSSAPASENSARIQAVQDLADWASFTETSSLSLNDGQKAITQLKSSGRSVAACISVWEGYRQIMASMNQELGVVDLRPETVGLLTDKLEMRAVLRQAGLSQVHSEILTEEKLHAAKKAGTARFIKPRKGLASFGAFKMTRGLEMKQLQAMAAQMMGDEDYRDLFGASGPQFLIEDYISGREFSFEMVAMDGKSSVLAVHEKTEVEEAANTTLESACISPPISLGQDGMLSGARFVQDCFVALGVEQGCFHVEAKFDFARWRWEIIEINPRVGGAFINASTAAIQKDTCLLELWLRALTRVVASATAPDDSRSSEQLEQELAARDISRQVPDVETFFRVYFAEAGRRLLQVEIAPVELEPSHIRLMARAGEETPDSAREIFLAQAMWIGTRGSLRSRPEEIKKISRRAVRIEYAATETEMKNQTQELIAPKAM